MPLDNDSVSNERLLNAIEQLNASVNRLYSLFDNVKKELLDEWEKGKDPEDDLHSRIDALFEQNKHIAESILVLSERIEPRRQEAPVRVEEPRQAFAQPLPAPQIPEMPKEQAVSENDLEGIRKTLGIQSRPKPQGMDAWQATSRPQQFAMPQAPQMQEFPKPFQPEAPFIEPNFPTFKAYPELPMAPSIGKEIHAEPTRPKRKVFGLF